VMPTALLGFPNAAAAPFLVAGVPIARDAFVAEAGLDWRLGEAVTLGLSYAGQIAEREHDHSVKGSLVVRF
jgi:uncharacterized protein with beta-barrel porin domain